MLTLSDPEFHTRIMHKYRSGKRKYIVFPALVYNQLPRWLITFHNKLHVTVQLRQMFQGFAYKPVPEALALKDNRYYVKGSAISFTKKIFQWIPVATKETKNIFISNVMGLPSRKAIPSTLNDPGLFNPFFFSTVLNRNILNAGKRARPKDIKNNAFQNPDKWKSHLVSGNKMYLLSDISNSDLTDIGSSGWKKNLLIPSLSLSDVNRNMQVHPAHKYKPVLPDSKNVLRINRAQNSVVSNEAIVPLNIQASDVSGAGKELVFHAPPDIEQLIDQKLGELKSSMNPTEETIMAQSAMQYSKIETDLKRQFNIDQISEQVYRQIDHRLKIECERRGIL